MHFKITRLALGQSNICSNASAETLKNMGHWNTLIFLWPPYNHWKQYKVKPCGYSMFFGVLVIMTNPVGLCNIGYPGYLSEMHLKPKSRDHNIFLGYPIPLKFHTEHGNHYPVLWKISKCLDTWNRYDGPTGFRGIWVSCEFRTDILYGTSPLVGWDYTIDNPILSVNHNPITNRGPF